MPAWYRPSTIQSRKWLFCTWGLRQPRPTQCAHLPDKSITHFYPHEKIPVSCRRTAPSFTCFPSQTSSAVALAGYGSVVISGHSECGYVAHQQRNSNITAARSLPQAAGWNQPYPRTRVPGEGMDVTGTRVFVSLRLPRDDISGGQRGGSTRATASPQILSILTVDDVTGSEDTAADRWPGPIVRIGRRSRSTLSPQRDRLCPQAMGAAPPY